MAKAVSLDQDDRRRPTADKKEESGRAASLGQAIPQQSSFFSRLRPQAQIGEEDDSDTDGSTTEETSGSEDEEEEDEEEEDEEEPEGMVPKTPSTGVSARKEEDMTSSVSALLSRSAQARRGSQDVRSSTPTSRKEGTPTTRHSQYARDKEEESGRYKSWRDAPSSSVDDPTSGSSRYGSAFMANRKRAEEEPDDSNRFLSRSRSYAVVNQSDSRPERRKSQQESPATRTSSSSPSSAAALRRSRLARSKSSNEVLPGEADSPEENSTPVSPPYRSRYQPEPASSVLRSKSSHAVKDTSPEAGDQNGTGSSGGSSSWAQYLRNKYGCRSGGSAGSPGSKTVSRSRSSHAVYNRSGSDDNSSDDEVPGRGRGLDGGSSRHDGGPYGGYGFPRSMYLQKRRMQLKIGARGTEPGCFTWPRGVAVGPDNSIVVADSSNHRVQVSLLATSLRLVS